MELSANQISSSIAPINHKATSKYYFEISSKHWHTFDGDDIGSVGMRVEFYGCVADDILRKLFLT